MTYLYAWILKYNHRIIWQDIQEQPDGQQVTFIAQGFSPDDPYKLETRAFRWKIWNK